jgi:DNA-binding response OmpR family regulator
MQPKILIIEDDRFLSSIIKSRMERNSFLVEQAFDGEEGLTKLASFKPDLVILDLIMPKVSGFEFLERISQDPEFNQVPILIASNLGQESDIEKAKSLGAIDYYVKVRTSIDDLENMIKNQVAKKFEFQAQPQTQQ